MQAAKKLPTHDVFTVSEPEGDEKEPFWTKIGAAWEHKDGLGYNVQLQALPVDGRLVMRFNKPKDEDRQDNKDRPGNRDDYRSRSGR
jgi:hypothetical protein